MKVLVVGCGRVGSASPAPRGADWDVSVIDEKEEALGRLGDGWRGAFSSATAWTRAAREGRHRGRRRGRRRDERRQHEHRRRPGRAAALRRRLVVVRILDPARAEFYAHAGHEHRLPDADGDRPAHRQRAHVRRRRGRARGGGALMYALIAGGGKVGANVLRTLLRHGHEATLIEQRARPLRAARGGVRAPGAHGDATEIHVLERAGIERPPDLVLAVTGDDEDNIVICQLARETYGVEKVIARVNDPRNQPHFDLLGISPTVSATASIMALDRARGARARARPPARAAQGEPRDRRGADRPRRPCTGKPIGQLACPRARA